MTEPALSAPRRRHSALAWSLGALLVGLLFSFLLAREHSRLLKQQDEVALESAVDRVFDGLSDQLETCGVLIRALQTLFTPPDAVSPDRFAAIYVNLRPKASFPGLIAMAYSRRERAPDGELSYPTELVAPLAGNERVLGLDVTRQPGNLSALERSRDSGEPALSESFRLVQRAAVDERADGITLRLPVYRDGVTPDTVGCRFALDDFGAGMSSFGYLKNLPLDFIKIDGSFIRELETDPMIYSIVRAVTEIGHQVGVAVVAECVGNAGTIELLRGLRVDYAQGEAVHEPAPTGLS